MTSTPYIQSNEGGLYALMPVTADGVFGTVNGAPQATTFSKSSETTDTEPQRLLSPRQIRDLTGLHEEVIRRAIRDGELRASKLRGKLRVRPQDYDAWIDQNAVVPGDWA